jgi:hypothetical protein
MIFQNAFEEGPQRSSKTSGNHLTAIVHYFQSAHERGESVAREPVDIPKELLFSHDSVTAVFPAPPRGLSTL